MDELQKILAEVLVVVKVGAAWAAENGDNPLFRIALCGYDGDSGGAQ